MGVIICSFWCDLGSPLLGKGGTSWLVSFVGKKCKKAWKLAPLCLFWTVWKERNMIAFDNEEFLVLDEVVYRY